ncbi:hypothetical protein KGF66_14625 [Lactiplantibacillus pentosus]|uniref:Mobilization protein n=2 Tax=Lactiplantibacillus pentosus TaxID=1589 RepID=A0AAW8WJ97_LACPE|nr:MULTISPECIES: hypothetical protein [Lactiplantibacillus]MBU7485295.1 hypothetical protein [Lactiplantibacillus sp. 30.2.29]MBU7488523.1 hypothetical protein [Lactiplantibacillus pentosus]MBU7501599.1 hypothetical protein [Lactiplantibacillus pentosus]MBU7508092.1 hypothetical protein [Lactiplantibacillus pentosus]MBU7514469.1 hypothetical protein [Lactiplantibacillus pentosus]
MNDNEKMVKQLFDAYENGQINFNNVPAFKNLVTQAAQEQLSQTLSTTALKEKQQAALKDEKTWYHQQVEHILQDKQNQLDTTAFQQSVLGDLTSARNEVLDQQQELAEQKMQLEAAEKKHFWQNLSVALLQVLCCLVYAWFIFIVLKKFLYDGIWNGWGLHTLYSTVWALHTDHYIGSIILGIVGVLVIGIVIGFSFWSVAHIIPFLADFKPSQLKFWHKR